MKLAKSIYAGAGLALTAGLLMGAAMKPSLGDDDRPIGPQIFAGWSGVRSTGPFDGGDLAFAAYSSQIPDYVVGRDWARLSQPVAWRADPEPRGDEAYTEAPAAAETPTFSRATYEEPQREPTSFPSMDGGRRYDAPPPAPAAPVAQAAPEPRQQLAELDDEAPPEATGDTSVN